MKSRLFYPLFCLVMMLAFTGCSDDDEMPSYKYAKLNDLQLTLTEVARSASTCTFNVEASDPDVNYLCLYVDKATIDNVAKGDLPEFLMDDLKQQADAKGESFESFLAPLLRKGNQEALKVASLLPGRLYELVVFGVEGTKAAQKAEYLFFQTLLADPVDCSFEVTVEPAGKTAKFDVTPSKEDLTYHFATFPKHIYDRMVASNLSDEAMLMEYYFAQVERMVASLMEPNQQRPTQAQFNKAYEMLLFSGKEKLTAKGLTADAEYVWLAGAVQLVDIDGALNPVLVSPAAKGDYKTLPLDLMRDFTFDIQVSDITATTAHLVLTPSLAEEKYIFVYKPYNDKTSQMDVESLVQMHIKQFGPFVGMMARPGKIDIKMDLVPNKKYYLLAFGYNGGVTSKPALYEFESLPGGDPAKLTFTAKPVKNTPYNLTAKVTPSDATVPYVVRWYKTTPDFNLQVEKELVESAIAQNYKMNSMWNPGMTLIDFLYTSSSIYRGTRDFQNYDAKMGETYTLCAFGLNMEGKVATTFVKESFASVPNLSDATVSAEILGYFNGDEEAGSLFGNAEATKGKAIIAMKYTLSPSAVSGKSGIMDDQKEVDELDPAVISDKELMNRVNWSKLAKSGYSFVLAQWDVPLVSFAYAVNDKEHEGVVNRMAVPAPDATKVNPIEELHKIYAQANSARFTRILKWAPLAEENSQEVERIQVPLKPWTAVEAENEVKMPQLGDDFHFSIAHPVK